MRQESGGMFHFNHSQANAKYGHWERGTVFCCILEGRYICVLKVEK
ncbi:MAG: hypothetical protein ACTSP1_05940 [Candidatus Freyarchaeota archaeon]